MSRQLYPRGTKDENEAHAILTHTKVGKAVVFLLELTNRPDNRLTPNFLKNCIMPALDDVELEWRSARDNSSKNPAGDNANGDQRYPAALITCGPKDKHRFYSNGLDLKLSQSTPDFFPNYYDPVLLRFLLFPIPTVAALNGHGFAGGMGLAMAHDFRVMKAVEGEGKGRAMMSMNEVEFGSVLPKGITEVLRFKIPSSIDLRDTVLTAKRWSAKEALDARLVDDIAPTGPETIDRAIQLGAQASLKSEISGLSGMKQVIYEPLIATLKNTGHHTPSIGTSASENRERISQLRSSKL